MTTEEVRRLGNAAQRQRGLDRAREVLDLYDQGLRGDDLAARLGVAPASVRSLLTRSRRRVEAAAERRLSPTRCTYCGDTDHSGPC